ncbi:G5 domain-containing protein, partial [Escherichia coli]|nr:G5 domain-containing protein [Escherichia coli]
EKVQTEGEEGILEKTNLVTRTGDKVVSSNTFATWVKKAPVEKVVLVGTGNPQPAATSAPAQTSNNSNTNANNSSQQA